MPAVPASVPVPNQGEGQAQDEARSQGGAGSDGGARSKGEAGPESDAPARFDPRRWVRRPRWMSGHPRRAWSLLSVALIGVGVVWIVVTGLIARAQVEGARNDLRTLQVAISAGKVAQVQVDAGSFGRRAHRAHLLTTGPAWWLGAAVPYLGRPLVSVRGSAAGLDRTARLVVEPLIPVVQSLDPARVINARGRVDALMLARAAPPLARVVAAADHVRDSLGALPAGTWLPLADSTRAGLLRELTGAHDALMRATTAARIAPGLLGAQGPRRYFVAQLDPAESRGLGGVPGGFLIIVANRGRLRITHAEPDTVLRNVNSGLDLGVGYAARYGRYAPGRTYLNSAISPNFPDAARIWAAMWERQSGERVDGAVSLDPTALRYLLAATGPATVPTGEKVRASTVVALTQRTAYARYPGTALRRRYLLDITQAVGTQVLSGAGDHAALVTAIARAAGERRLLLWSADESIESQLTPTALGGVLPETHAPFGLMTVANAAGTKLDYYLTRSVTWQASGCGPTRTVAVAMTLTNDLPPTRLPASVTRRTDHSGGRRQPGDNRLRVSYYATAGATLRRASIDGRTSAVLTQAEHGHPVFVADLEIRPNATRTIVLTLTEPGTGPVLMLTQPLDRPLVLFTEATGCG